MRNWEYFLNRNLLLISLIPFAKVWDSFLKEIVGPLKPLLNYCIVKSFNGQDLWCSWEWKKIGNADNYKRLMQEINYPGG